MSIPTIVSLTVSEPGYDERSLEDAVSHLRRWKMFIDKAAEQGDHELKIIKLSNEGRSEVT